MLIAGQASAGARQVVVGRDAGLNMRWGVYNDASTGFAFMAYPGDNVHWGDTRGVTALATGDLDGDGREEIVVGRNPGLNMRWGVYNDANPFFAFMAYPGDNVHWGDTRGVTALATADLDGDGHPEIIVGRNAGLNMRWAVCKYDVAAKDCSTLTYPGDNVHWGDTRGVTALATADLDGDGHPEIIVGRDAGLNMRWGVCKYDAATGDCSTLTYPGDNVHWGDTRGVTALATADLDGDGHPEIIVGRNAGLNMRWAVCKYDAATGDCSTLTYPGDNVHWGDTRGVTALATADLDGDGHPEIIVGRNAGLNMRWAVCKYDAATGDCSTLTYPGDNVHWGDTRGVTALATGDVDDDGHPEIIVGRNAGLNMRWAVCKYDAATGDCSTLTYPGDNVHWGYRGTSALAVADTGGADSDGDGLLDIWETAGFDANEDGIPEVNLPAFGVNPNRTRICFWN